MKTNKLLVFAAIALLIINVVLAYFLWNSKKQHPREKRGGDRGDWIVNELKLDDNQKAEHKKIKDAHFAAMKPIFDSITSARRNLYELLKDSTVSDSIVNSYTRIIGENHAKLSQNTFDHFKKIRAICNPEQQRKLDTLVQKVVQDMGKRGGGKGREKK
jgi:periplasmic protein CpxP/Spy